ncbi:Protein of unknown function [Cellulosimicrobium cellulans]|nr:Protein of unknown function [Cellulosimicrobium cellulans]
MRERRSQPTAAHGEPGCRGYSAPCGPVGIWAPSGERCQSRRAHRASHGLSRYALDMALPSEVEDLIRPTVDTVYHYTDASGLLSIVQSNELWATESHGMNDTAEIQQGWDFVLAWLRRQDPNDATAKYLLSAALEGGNDYTYTFFCCASTAPDDANQWRNYAAGGHGFAIELDTAPAYGVVTEVAPPKEPDNPKAIGAILPGWIKFLDSYEATPWLNVLYESSAKERVLEIYLEAARAEGQGVSEEGARSAERVHFDIGLHERRADLEAIARLMKAPGFAGEREVRLVVSSFNSRYASLRAGRYGITMYQRLARTDSSSATSEITPRYNFAVGDSRQCLPIPAIWVGPLADATTNQSSIRELLSRGGHESVELVASRVPLR